MVADHRIFVLDGVFSRQRNEHQGIEDIRRNWEMGKAVVNGGSEQERSEEDVI